MRCFAAFFLLFTFIFISESFSTVDTLLIGNDVNFFVDFDVDYSDNGKIGIFCYKCYQEDEDLQGSYAVFDFHEFRKFRREDISKDFYYLMSMHRVGEYHYNQLALNRVSINYTEDNDLNLFWYECDNGLTDKPYYLMNQNRVKGVWSESQRLVSDTSEILKFDSMYDSVHHETVLYYDLLTMPIYKRKSPYILSCPLGGNWNEEKPILNQCYYTWAMQSRNSMKINQNGNRDFIVFMNSSLNDSSSIGIPNKSDKLSICRTSMNHGEEWSPLEKIYTGDKYYNRLIYLSDSKGFEYVIGTVSISCDSGSINQMPLEIFYMVTSDGVTWTEPETIYKYDCKGKFFRFIQDIDAEMDRNGIIHIAWHFVDLSSDEGFKIYSMSGNFLDGWSIPDSITKGPNCDSNIPPHLANDPDGNTYLFYVYYENAGINGSENYFLMENLTKKYTPVCESKKNNLNSAERPLYCRNYPSPFSEGTAFQVTAKMPMNIDINIYNTLGQKVKSLAKNCFISQTSQIQWDGKDDLGNSIASGVYLYEIIGKTGNWEYRFNGKTLKLK